MPDLVAIAQKVSLAIRDSANDIDAYLASDVPLECYRKDIDYKLNCMKVEVVKMILEQTGIPVEVINPPTPPKHEAEQFNLPHVS